MTFGPEGGFKGTHLRVDAAEILASLGKNYVKASDVNRTLYDLQQLTSRRMRGQGIIAGGAGGAMFTLPFVASRRAGGFGTPPFVPGTPGEQTLSVTTGALGSIVGRVVENAAGAAFSRLFHREQTRTAETSRSQEAANQFRQSRGQAEMALAQAVMRGQRNL